MKSIKIKLKYQNNVKTKKLFDIFEILNNVSKQYLMLKKQELETKDYSLTKDFYSNIRKQYPELNSAILQQCTKYIDKTIKSYIAICKKKKKLVKLPEKINPSINLRNDCFKFEYNKDTKTFNAWLKFLRTYFPLNLCDYHIKSLENMEKIADSSIMLDSNGQLNLRLCFHTKEIELTNDKVLGIDIGIVKPIVTSDGKQFGSGKFIKHKKIEFGKKRAKNQSKKEQISIKQSNWTNNLNHKLSRQLINYCISQGINVLGIEKLKGNELSNKKFRRYSWAFKDLLNKIEYKAQNAGLKVINVDPKYTSQRCNVCGHIDKTNRQTQDKFHCCYCNSVFNADINAAKNIYNLSVIDGPTVTVARVKALNSNREDTLLQGV